MTFFEAAVEVLRQAGRSLHFKKITELAIEQDLLSHVGRTPHVTMEARLSQESEKEAGAQVRRVRPGVYALSEGVAETRVQETQPVAPQPEDDDDDDDAQPDAQASGPWRRRRRRRRSGYEAEGLDGASADRPGEPAAQPSRPRFPTLADAVTEALAAAGRPMTADELAEKLSLEPDDPVSPLVLEQSIRTANRRRLGSGLRPVFTRLEQGWVLTQAEIESDVVEVYDSLERVHAKLVGGTIDGLVRSLERLRGRELEAFVRATLDGLGYAVSPLDRSDEAALFAARLTDALVPIKAVVSVWHADAPITGNTVAALRGRLQRYGATHGVAVALRRGGIDATARAEANASGEAQPVVLCDARALAPLALRARVGVVGYALEVPLLDATWFRSRLAD